MASLICVSSCIIFAVLGNANAKTPKSEINDPKIFIRKLSVKLTDNKIFHTQDALDQQNLRLEESKYFEKVGNDQFKVSNDVFGFTISCKAPYPVYWEFNQNEGGPVRDTAKELALYTERNASTGPTSFSTGFPQTDNFLANLQVIFLQNEFTGNYSCNSVSDSKVLKSMFLFIRRSSSSGSYFVFDSKNITVVHKLKDKFVTLPCLLNSPDSGFKVNLYKLINEKNETWQKLSLNESIRFDKTSGFHLKAKKLPTLLGRYRCTGSSEFSKRLEYVNITVTDTAKYSNLHFDDPKLTVNPSIEESAIFQFKKSISDYMLSFTKLTCCSSDDKNGLAGSPTIFESECHNPMHCRSRRTFISQERLFSSPGGFNRGWDANCTSTVIGPKASVFKCFGKGIYVMNEYYPTFSISTANQLFNNQNTRKFGDVAQEKSVLALEIKARNVSNPTTDGDKYFVAKCHYIEYFISDGLFWKLEWNNGTTQWIKGMKNSYYEYYRGGGVDMNPAPMELALMIKLKNLNSISCYGPVWNSKEWISIKADYLSARLENNEDGILKVRRNNLEITEITVSRSSKYTSSSGSSKFGFEKVAFIFILTFRFIILS